MVNLITFFQTAQNRDRIFDRRLIDQDSLEPPFKRGILFDVFPVFIERRRSDEVQLTTR